MGLSSGGTAQSPRAASSRSTYFAMTSASRLTSLPGLASRRFVTCRVNGIRATDKAPSRMPQTVSDMPSMRWSPSRQGTLGSLRRLDRDLRGLAEPPHLPHEADAVDVPLHDVAVEASVGLHRPLEVDEAPGTSRSSKRVRRSVSAVRSTSKPCASERTAVRQQPFTATLPPSGSPSNTRRRRSAPSSRRPAAAPSEPCQCPPRYL